MVFCHPPNDWAGMCCTVRDAGPLLKRRALARLETKLSTRCWRCLLKKNRALLAPRKTDDNSRLLTSMSTCLPVEGAIEIAAEISFTHACKACCELSLVIINKCTKS